MSSIIKKYVKEYQSMFLNELYDSPLKFKTYDDKRYQILQGGEILANVIFHPQYGVDNSPIDHNRYNISKYWDISWRWGDDIDKSNQNVSNFIKVTSTMFPIVEEFIRNNNYPQLLGFSGLTESHDRIYSDELFIERWEGLLGEKYEVKWHNDKVWIINKNISYIDEYKIIQLSEHFKLPPSQIYRMIKYPNKKDKEGISKNILIKEQIKRIILKQIYLR